MLYIIEQEDVYFYRQMPYKDLFIITQKQPIHIQIRNLIRSIRVNTL